MTATETKTEMAKILAEDGPMAVSILLGGSSDELETVFLERLWGILESSPRHRMILRTAQHLLASTGRSCEGALEEAEQFVSVAERPWLEAWHAHGSREGGAQ